MYGSDSSFVRMLLYLSFGPSKSVPFILKMRNQAHYLPNTRLWVGGKAKIEPRSSDSEARTLELIAFAADEFISEREDCIHIEMFSNITFI